MRKCASLLVLLVFLGGCGAEGPPVPTAEELPTIAVTRWTEKTELFMEYPPLVAGEKARFAVHLTNLNDFTPLTAGHRGRHRQRGPSRRFFRQGEVRLALLSLLGEELAHGYELIKRMEERSGGMYRASAGTVYPPLKRKAGRSKTSLHEITRHAVCPHRQCWACGVCLCRETKFRSHPRG